MCYLLIFNLMCNVSHHGLILACEHVVSHNSFNNGNMGIDIDVFMCHNMLCVHISETLISKTEVPRCLISPELGLNNIYLIFQK